MSPVRVTIVAGNPEVRRSLQALLSGSPGISLLGVHRGTGEALTPLETRPGDVVVVTASDFQRLLDAVRELAARLPTLKLLALSPDAGEEAMIELIRAGARGCLPAALTRPSRLLEAIAELHQGGAPLSSRLAAALVRLVQAQRPPNTTEPRISRREVELLNLLAEGHSYKTAAAELGISVDTVRFHLRNLYAKLQVHSKVEAVLRATKSGLI